ncbi:MAG: PQQ-binding-like beta-propeller repeat protein [Clostridia bacterium]
MSKKAKIVVGVIAGVIAVALVATGITLGVIFSSKGPFTGTVIDASTHTPMAGVSVSDGRNVVKTDAEGKFTLDGYYKSRFVTVTTPSGYVADSYYQHVEKGKESYDFKLTPNAGMGQEKHSFIQVSDSEIGEDGVGPWIDSIHAMVEEQHPAFIIHTGDICYEAGLKRHIQDMNSENMGVPVYYTIGNHDYVDGKYGEELFESIYGPVWYSFEVGNIHYVVTPFQNGADYKSGYNENDRWRWLANDLANTDPDMKVVMFNHTISPEEDYVFQFDKQTLDLKEHNLVAWIYGHYHYNYINEQDGVINICTSQPGGGGIDSSVSGSRLITLDGGGNLTTQMFYYDFTGTPAAAENAAWSTQLEGRVLFTDTVTSPDGIRVYTATVGDDVPNKCGIYCLDAQTGEILWYIPTKNSIKNNLIYQNDKIYTQDTEGLVYCLNASDGSEIWTAQVDLQRSLGTSSGLCMDEKAVYAGSASDVSAFNAETGEKLWDYHRNRGENSPAEFVLAGDKLILSSHWDAIFALDKNTGSLLWENMDEDIRFRSSTPIAIDANRLLVADDDAVAIVNLENGEITKTNFENYNFGSSGQPVIDGNIAYLPTATKGIVAFDLDTQQIVWEMQPGTALAFTACYTNAKNALTVEGTPVLSGDQLIFAASDGYLYHINKADGTVLSKTNIGAPVFGKVALNADGSVIVGDFAGRITRIAAAQ